MALSLLFPCSYKKIYMIQAFLVLKFEKPIERDLLDYLKIKITDDFLIEVFETQTQYLSPFN